MQLTAVCQTIAPYGLTPPPVKAVLLLAGSLALIQMVAKAAFAHLTSPEIGDSDVKIESHDPYQIVVTEETGARLSKIKAAKALYSLSAVGSAVIPTCINPQHTAFYLVSLILFAHFFAGPTTDNLLDKLPLAVGNLDVFSDEGIPVIADTQRFNNALQYHPAAAQIPYQGG